jgi:hypothetical protein
MAADNQLNIRVVVDAAQLTAGMSAATATVESAAQKMATGFQPVIRVSQQTFDNIEGGALKARESIALLGEEFGVKIPRALRGTIAGMEGLGAALTAAFPIFAAIAFVDVLGTAYDHLRKVSLEAFNNAEAWQKINHESASAMEAANKGIEHLQVQITELTKGKMAALKLEMTFIGDSSVEMSGRMQTAFESMGKQIEKEMPLLDKLKEFFIFIGNSGSFTVIPRLGESVRAFGSELSKTLDTQGTVAGVHLIAQQIREVNAELAKAPEDKGLVQYLDQLIKKREELTLALRKEALEQGKNKGEQSKEAAKELAKQREEIDKFVTKMRELAKERVNLADAEKALITESAAFRLKEQGKEIIGAAKTAAEIADTERKFQADRLQDARDLAIANVQLQEHAVEEQLRLERITNEQARILLNKLVADKLAIELKYIKDRETLILERMKTDDAKAYADDAAAWSKLLHDKQQAQITADAATQKNNEKTATEGYKALQKLFDSIKSGFDSMIRGVLQGTQTLRQLFARLGTDMLVIMAEAFAKMALNFLKHRFIMVAANASTEAAITGATAAGTTARGAIEKSHSLAGIARAAAHAAAKAFHEVPFPLNFVVAPIVFAAALAFGAGLPSAAGGWNLVPNDNTFALLHKNEKVLTAGEASLVRNFVGSGDQGGGGDVHINYSPQIHAIDARGMREALKGHADTIVGLLRQHQREFKV